MKEKLKSRKLWVAVIAAVVIALNEQLQLGFSQEAILGWVTIAVTYILGQSHVDAKKVAAAPVDPGPGYVPEPDEHEKYN